MNFLHRNTQWVIYPLTKVWNKSDYSIAWDSIEWVLKPYSLEDQVFQTTWDSWSLFKLTIKGFNWVLRAWDRIIIQDVVYNVKDLKRYTGITFNTIKILLSSH